jgi:hypothetical protein
MPLLLSQPKPNTLALSGRLHGCSDTLHRPSYPQPIPSVSRYSLVCGAEDTAASGVDSAYTGTHTGVTRTLPHLLSALNTHGFKWTVCTDPKDWFVKPPWPLASPLSLTPS